MLFEPRRDTVPGAYPPRLVLTVAAAGAPLCVGVAYTAIVDGRAVVSLETARVVSAAPGRLRIRVARGPSATGELARVERALDAIHEVTEVAVRVHAASVVAQFDPRDAATVTARLDALGLTVAKSESSHPAENPATVAREAAGALNGALARRVPHGDLRTLVPLGLGLLSVRQALRGTDRLGDAPWYLLAWYASETFFKFYGAPATWRSGKQQEED